MRRYEAIVIVNPDLSEEGCKSICDKLNKLIEQYGGLLIGTDDWGVKKIAYEIKKKSLGHYFRFDFCSEVTMIDEMERLFRINDNIFKFMTIVLEKKANIEAIRNTIAEAELEEAETTAELENEKKPIELSESEIIVKKEE